MGFNLFSRYTKAAARANLKFVESKLNIRLNKKRNEIEKTDGEIAKLVSRFMHSYFLLIGFIIQFIHYSSRRMTTTKLESSQKKLLRIGIT